MTAVLRSASCESAFSSSPSLFARAFFAKLVIVDERLASRFGEPSGLEDPRGFVSIGHKVGSA